MKPQDSVLIDSVYGVILPLIMDGQYLRKRLDGAGSGETVSSVQAGPEAKRHGFLSKPYLQLAR